MSLACVTVASTYWVTSVFAVHVDTKNTDTLMHIEILLKVRYFYFMCHFVEILNVWSTNKLL